jgi:hypothetical protein
VNANLCTFLGFVHMGHTHTHIVHEPGDKTRNKCHSSYVKTQVSSSLGVLKVHSHLVLMTLVLSPLTHEAGHLEPRLIYHEDFMFTFT